MSEGLAAATDKRERAAELRRVSSRIDARSSKLVVARKLHAAQQSHVRCAIDKAMRDEVQAFIAKDDLTGEDPEVRRIAVNALGNHAGTVVVMDP